MKKLLSIRNALSLCLIVFAAASEAGSIAGSLKLPQTYSQTGDMQIWIRARSTTTFDQRQQLLTITQAQAIPGALIGFSLSNLNDGEQYQLRYDCQSFSFPEPCRNIVGRAHYKAINQSVLRAAEGTLISGALDTTNIELPMLTGVTVSGDVLLPATFSAPPGGLNFRVRASTSDSPDILPAIHGVIAEGETTSSYRITLPDDASESWLINYRCLPGATNPNGACDEYLTTGYYNSSVSNATVESVEEAEPLIGNQNWQNINLTLLNNFILSGVLTVPTEPSDNDGIEVAVLARDVNNPAVSYRQIINIAQGETSSPFRVSVPRDPAALWQISYVCRVSNTPNECAKYLIEGYFDSQTPVTMASPRQMDADQLAGGQSYANINFSMLAGSEISGIVQLSKGKAPAGGIRFTVRAADTSSAGSVSSTSVLIPEGASDVAYKLTVDPSPTTLWRLSFDCEQLQTPVCLSIADEGFYDASTGDTFDEATSATPLAGGQDHNNIDFMVESAALLPNEFCLPIKTSNDSIAVICL